MKQRPNQSSCHRSPATKHRQAALESFYAIIQPGLHEDHPLSQADINQLGSYGRPILGPPCQTLTVWHELNSLAGKDLAAHQDARRACLEIPTD